MKNTCHKTILVCVYFALLGFVICQSQTVQATPRHINKPFIGASPARLKIGALLPLTGDLMKLGLTAKYTLEQSKEDFLTEYPSSSIELLFADTKSDPVTALAQAKELYNQGVQIIIGSLASADLTAIKPFVDENGIIVIDPTSSAPSLAIDDTIFRLTIPDTEQAKALATYALYKGYQSVVPIYRQDVYGNGLYTAFQEQFTEAGGTSVEGIGYSVPISNVSALIASLSQKVKNVLQTTAAEKTAVLCISYDEATQIFKEAANDSILASVQWLGSDSLSKSDLILDDPAAAAFASLTQFTASINTSQSYRHPYFPIVYYYEDLITKVRSRYDKLNEAYVGVIYDAFWLAALVLQNSNNSPSKESVIETTANYYGYGGALDFDENGDRKYGYFAFYRLDRHESSCQWNLIASYVKNKYKLDVPFLYREFTNNSQDKILKMGALISLTGSYKESGTNIQKSLGFIQGNINELLKRYYTPNSKVEILTEDTASDPAIALEKMKQLQQNGVQFFIGPTISAELEECLEYADNQNLFIFSPSSTSMVLALDDSTYRLMLNDEKQAKALAKYIYELGYRYIEPVYCNDLYGKGLTQLFAGRFSELGGSCGNGIAYDVGAADFSSMVQNLNANLSAVDNQKKAVLLIAFDEYIQIMQAASAYPSLSGIRWFGTDSTALNSLLATNVTAAAFALKTRYTASIMSNSNFDICPYLENLKNDLIRNLGSTPNAISINSCDAAGILMLIAMYLDWDFQHSENELKEAIKLTLNKSVGYLQGNMVDSNGDRLYGNFDFCEYSVPDETNIAHWKTDAQYIYFYNLEELTWLEEKPASQSAHWELYN